MEMDGMVGTFKYLESIIALDFQREIMTKEDPLKLHGHLDLVFTVICNVLT